MITDTDTQKDGRNKLKTKNQENQDETLRIFFDLKRKNAETILLSENSSNCGDVNELDEQEDHEIELPLSIKTYKDRSKKGNAFNSIRKTTEKGLSESRNEESVVVFNCDDLISSSGTCKETLSRSSSCKGSLSIVDEQDSMFETSPKMMYNQTANSTG